MKLSKLSPGWTVFGFVMTFAILVWTQLYPFLGNSFSVDSYTYYLLGHNLLHGLGYTSNAINDLSTPHTFFPNPSRSFPPLLPVLIGIVDRLTDLKIQSGLYVDLLVAILTAWAYAVLCKLVSPDRWKLLLLVFPVFLICSHDYQDEVAAGRSIPIVLLFYLLLLVLFFKSLARERVRTSFCILMGFLLGGMTLARFDQLIFALGFPCLAFLIYLVLGMKTRESARAGLTILGSFVLFFSPWGIRNYRVFGAFFSSNNSVTALSTQVGALHLFFWRTGNMAPNLFQSPGLWLGQRVGYLFQNVSRVLKNSRGILLVVPLLSAFFYKKLSRNELMFFVITLAFAAANFATISMTDFPESRYFCLLIFMLFLLFFMLITGPLANIAPALKLPIVAIVSSYVLFFGEAGVLDVVKDVRAHGFQWVPQSMATTESEMIRLGVDFEKVLGPQLAHEPVVAINNADVFTYYTGLRAVFPPRNSSSWDENMQAWAEKWKPDFIIAPRAWVRSFGFDQAVVARSIDEFEIVDVRKINSAK